MQFDFHFPPVFKKLKRGGPAVILPKDVGTILGYSGLTRDSLVVEAGSGSGFLTIALAQIAKKVISYEIKEEFHQLAKSNAQKAGLTNIDFRLTSVLEGIPEKDADCVVLDMQESVKAVPIAHASLASGGTLAGYLPNIEQAKDFALECKKLFKDVFMLENIMRDYEIRDFGVRPKHWGLTHTAYLVFARK